MSLDLNLDFLDLYKSVDRFIRDAYSSGEGVSEYLRKMEENRMQGVRLVRSWSNDYDMLKRVRWIRNQLSHEVGYDSDICEGKDYDWLLAFRDRLFSTEDPLAALYKQETAMRRRRTEEQKQTRVSPQTVSASKVPSAKPGEKKQSLWIRIRRLIFGK